MQFWCITNEISSVIPRSAEDAVFKRTRVALRTVLVGLATGDAALFTDRTSWWDSQAGSLPCTGDGCVGGPQNVTSTWTVVPELSH